MVQAEGLHFSKVRLFFTTEITI